MTLKTSYYSNNLYFIIDSTLEPNLDSPVSAGVVSGVDSPPKALKRRYFEGISEVVIPDPNIILTPTPEGPEIPVAPSPGLSPTMAPAMEGTQPVGGISVTPVDGGGYGGGGGGGGGGYY